MWIGEVPLLLQSHGSRRRCRLLKSLMYMHWLVCGGDTFLLLPLSFFTTHEQRNRRLDSRACWQWRWCTIGWRRRWYWRIWSRLVQRWGRSTTVCLFQSTLVLLLLPPQLTLPWIRLLALPEVERERILSERSEERQRNLERLEVRKLLNDGRREDTTRRKYHTSRRYASRITLLLSRIHTSKRKRHITSTEWTYSTSRGKAQESIQAWPTITHAWTQTYTIQWWECRRSKWNRGRWWILCWDKGNHGLWDEGRIAEG